MIITIRLKISDGTADAAASNIRTIGQFFLDKYKARAFFKTNKGEK